MVYPIVSCRKERNGVIPAKENDQLTNTAYHVRNHTINMQKSRTQTTTGKNPCAGAIRSPIARFGWKRLPFQEFISTTLLITTFFPPDVLFTVSKCCTRLYSHEEMLTRIRCSVVLEHTCTHNTKEIILTWVRLMKMISW